MEVRLLDENGSYDKIYFIDTENVGLKWMSLLVSLGEHDVIILCYTDASGKYGLDDVQTILQYQDKLKFAKCFNGHANALDFQLSVMIGYLYHSYRESEFVIVSNDMGYCSVVEYLKEVGANISQLRLCHQQQQHYVSNSEEESKFVVDELMAILNIGNQDGIIIRSMLDSVYYSKDSYAMKSRDVNNFLQHEYGSLGQKYYKLLRDNRILDRLM